MRNLNAKQKKMLQRIASERGADSVNDLTSEEMITLTRMNDHETLFQNIERYLSDATFARLYSR